MKKEKFLTIYAVFDDATQKALFEIQKAILKKYPYGTQTMGIPFHISLGSFSVEEKQKLIQRIGQQIEKLDRFSIDLDGLDHFNHSVLFIKPTLNEQLEMLHELFAGNYSDGNPWVPHTTLYCGEKEDIKNLLKEIHTSKISAQIVGLELGEFFPPQIILTSKF